MIWVSIILEIIQELPTLIKIIQDIIAAIEGKLGATEQFKAMVSKHRPPHGGKFASDSDRAAALADFQAFHTQHCTKPV